MAYLLAVNANPVICESVDLKRGLVLFFLVRNGQEKSMVLTMLDRDSPLMPLRLNPLEPCKQGGHLGQFWVHSEERSRPLHSRQPKANVLVQRNVCLHEHRREKNIKKFRLILYCSLLPYPLFYAQIHQLPNHLSSTF